MSYVPGAKLVGSNAEEPGTAELTLEFSKCQTVQGAEGCKVVESFKSAPLRATLVNIAEGAKKTKGLGVIYQPVKGSEFVKIDMTGQCRGGGNLDGSVVAQVRTAGAGVEPGNLIEDGKEPAEAKAMEWRLPNTEGIREIWRVHGGVGSLENVEQFFAGYLAGGGPTLELASGSLWGVFT